MKYSIKVTKSPNSRVSEVDFENIAFGTIFSDHMFVADYKDGEWINLEVKPFGKFSISPANLAFHYGQAFFEGMKATKVDDRAYLFRPEMHARRMNASGARLCMPTIPEELFLEALHTLVGLDSDWIPPIEGSALYIRPFMFATDVMFKVKVSDTYRFIIFTGPVGPYYPKPVRLWAEDKYVRAVKGGVGEAKAAGNYAAALLPAKKANERGFDQIMWLDAKDFRYIQEVGTMNIFFVIDDTVITPATDGAILKGITRDSVLRILRDKGLKVEERPVSIDEVMAADENGRLQEVFGTGTAAVVSNVSEIGYKNKIIQLPPIEQHHIAHMVKAEINGIRSGKLPDPYGWMVPVKEPVPA